jgi:hypothetical protein
MNTTSGNQLQAPLSPGIKRKGIKITGRIELPHYAVGPGRACPVEIGSTVPSPIFQNRSPRELPVSFKETAPPLEGSTAPQSDPTRDPIRG